MGWHYRIYSLLGFESPLLERTSRAGAKILQLAGGAGYFFRDGLWPGLGPRDRGALPPTK